MYNVFLPSEKKISLRDVSMVVSPCLAGAEDSKYLYLLPSFAFFGPELKHTQYL
jgi:hypothetical protein